MATEDPLSPEQEMVHSIRWDWVASLYDAYVTATFDLPFWLQHATAAKGTVLELMCGTGRISAPLAEAGVSLTCVDASAGMLARLREKLAARGLSAEVVQMDVRRLDLGREFDLVLLPFQSFAELTSPADQRDVLARIYRHLRAGGRFICTLHNPRARRQSLDGQLRLVGKFPLANQRATLLVWTLAAYDVETRLVEGLQFYEEYTEAGLLERKRLLEIRFALLECDEFAALATSAGFRTAALYGDYESAPFAEENSPFMIWVLEK
jgi:SAM-dependent methyltransferase